jgi:hypothetical protein
MGSTTRYIIVGVLGFLAIAFLPVDVSTAEGASNNGLQFAFITQAFLESAGGAIDQRVLTLEAIFLVGLFVYLKRFEHKELTEDEMILARIGREPAVAATVPDDAVTHRD